ncbi:MAG: aminotransferase, partial [Oscillospiraceae bacterium]|nr:aminotransferase [Oscillospiraceae bacterium]
MNYTAMDMQQLKNEHAKVLVQFEDLKSRGLKLNMARGKPGKAQLDMVSDILKVMVEPEQCVSDGLDVRNYGEL